MRNVSQSQSNSQSQAHLPPVLKPRSGQAAPGRRSIELPPVQQAVSEQNPSDQAASGANATPPPDSGGLPNRQAVAADAAKRRSQLKAKQHFKPNPKPNPKPDPKPNFKLKLNLNFKPALPQQTIARLKHLPQPRLNLPAVKLPAIPLPPLPAFLKAETKPWAWSIVWLRALGVFGGLGIVAFAWMASLPPLPECSTITRTSPGNQRLYCAQERARSGQLADLLAAITLLQGWSEQEPLYDEVQRSISEWSALVLIAARDRMAQNDLKGAIDTANQIPGSSSVYGEAQETIADWEAQWQKGEQAYAAAQAAMQAQKWAEASDWVSTLNELQQDYWRVTQADRLAQQIQAEKQGWQALNKARKLAQSRSMSDLAGAIGLAKDIVPQTFVWQASQADLQQWGQSLLDLAMRQWQQGDLQGAIAAAQQVPLNVPLPPEVQDLVKYSHAEQQVAQVSGNASWRQVWNLMEGITAMNQISPNSPLYEQAQAKETAWKAQFQDSVQLRWASLGAQLGQRSTLDWAIGQTQPLLGESPLTNQAQSLIATWQQQIQILEDEPILRTAETIAARNTIPDLQQAIAYLRQIPTDRATWSETQRLTAQWQQQIQTLEDQPIWNEAQTLAKREQYAEAIAIAGKIGSSRALYPQAQQGIEAWKMAIRSAEMAVDRKILDRAKEIAAKGDLTGAIATAAEIAPGRDLYLEAQGAIGQWLKQRDGDTLSSDPGSDEWL